MRIALLLPGLHAQARGAETVFESLGEELARAGDDVTLFGTGPERENTAYDYVRVRCVPRTRFELWPKVPPMRDEFKWEELTWVPDLLRKYRPARFDVALTCAFPFTNWVLRRGETRNVFVTQNGDWPAFDDASEHRWFDCDGLVCTNQTYFERNSERWTSSLIPNGVDVDAFSPGSGDRRRFGIPDDAQVVLMVSALEPTKRVTVGIEAVAEIDGAVLVVAGNGAQRDEIDQLASERLPGRFVRLSVPRTEMPTLYRSADVVFHPTLFEPFGNVYLESMATGIPLVAHRSPHTEWVTSGHAALVDTDDVRANVEALRSALGAARSTHEVTAIRERFSWPVVAAQYRQFLVDLSEGARPRIDD